MTTEAKRCDDFAPPPEVQPSDGFRLWAVVLAGGAGSRMGDLGKQIPKVFLPLGLEPVLNRPVQECLNQVGESGRVIVLTRKRLEDKLPGVNYEQWAKAWKTTHGTDARIELWFEEDATGVSARNLPSGACVGLAAFIELLGKVAQDRCPTHLLIVAGDNYFTSTLDDIVEGARRHNNECILAVRSIDDPQLAVGRFGVARVDETLPSPRPVNEYREKPKTRAGRTIALGIYCMPMVCLASIEGYLAKVQQENIENIERIDKFQQNYDEEVGVISKDSERARAKALPCGANGGG